MKLFDTHFHYDGEVLPSKYYNNILTTLAEAPQSEIGHVEQIFLNAVGGDYWQSALSRDFAQAIENAYFSVGVHPHQAEEFLATPNSFEEFRSHEKLIAIGELGLDYYYEESSRKAQKQVFQQFLNLALEWELPAIVHIRDQGDSEEAYSDAYSLLEVFAQAGGRFVVHCFTGSSTWAKRFLELGAYLGVTGIITFRRADNVRNVIKQIPSDRLLIETDSPYLAPVPHRGKTNHPGFLILVSAGVATERGCSVEEIATLTTQNAFNFFHIERTGET